jgi:hypothetical protein
MRDIPGADADPRFVDSLVEAGRSDEPASGATARALEALARGNGVAGSARGAASRDAWTAAAFVALAVAAGVVVVLGERSAPRPDAMMSTTTSSTATASAPSPQVVGDAPPQDAGRCYSTRQLLDVVGESLGMEDGGHHHSRLARLCWDDGSDSGTPVDTEVYLTIGPDGVPTTVGAVCDEPSVGQCVENDVRTWRFPPMGCLQEFSFKLHFVQR